MVLYRREGGGCGGKDRDRKTKRKSNTESQHCVYLYRNRKRNEIEKRSQKYCLPQVLLKKVCEFFMLYIRLCKNFSTFSFEYDVMQFIWLLKTLVGCFKTISWKRCLCFFNGKKCEYKPFWPSNYKSIKTLGFRSL